MYVDGNNLNSNEEQNNMYYRPLPPRQPNQGLVNAAMVLGILTIVTTVMMTVYLPLIFGGIAIILAIISRRSDGIFPKSSKIGLRCAICGLILNIFIVGGSVYTVFHNPEARAEFDTMFEQIYGQSFDEMMESIKNGEQPEMNNFDFSNFDF